MDSYAVEANTLGTWSKIGYTAPGATATGSSGSTANFKYTGSGSTNDDASDWMATALNALNDCVKGSTWTVTPFRDSNTGIVTYNAVMSNDAQCSTLTPNFKNFKTSS